MNYPQIKAITTGFSIGEMALDDYSYFVLEHEAKTNIWLKENAETIQVHSIQTIVFGEIAITTIIAYQAE